MQEGAGQSMFVQPGTNGFCLGFGFAHIEYRPSWIFPKTDVDPLRPQTGLSKGHWKLHSSVTGKVLRRVGPSGFTLPERMRGWENGLICSAYQTGGDGFRFHECFQGVLF